MDVQDINQMYVCGSRENVICVCCVLCDVPGSMYIYIHVCVCDVPGSMYLYIYTCVCVCVCVCASVGVPGSK